MSQRIFENAIDFMILKRSDKLHFWDFSGTSVASPSVLNVFLMASRNGKGGNVVAASEFN